MPDKEDEEDTLERCTREMTYTPSFESLFPHNVNNISSNTGSFCNSSCQNNDINRPPSQPPINYSPIPANTAPTTSHLLIRNYAPPPASASRLQSRLLQTKQLYRNDTQSAMQLGPPMQTVHILRAQHPPQTTHQVLYQHLQNSNQLQPQSQPQMQMQPQPSMQMQPQSQTPLHQQLHQTYQQFQPNSQQFMSQAHQQPNTQTNMPLNPHMQTINILRSPHPPQQLQTQQTHQQPTHQIFYQPLHNNNQPPMQPHSQPSLQPQSNPLPPPQSHQPIPPQTHQPIQPQSHQSLQPHSHLPLQQQSQPPQSQTPLQQLQQLQPQTQAPLQQMQQLQPQTQPPLQAPPPQNYQQQQPQTQQIPTLQYHPPQPPKVRPSRPQQRIQQPPVSVSSTTRIPLLQRSQSVGIQSTPELLNKACQFDGRPIMISKSLNATVCMIDKSCQVEPVEEKTFVDRACSPINFPPTNVPVRKKLTVKRRKIETKSPVEKDVESDSDINVIE